MLAYLRRVVLIAIALVALDPAFADEWMPPVVKTYYSADKHSRFTVTPREISGPLAYFQDKVDNKDKAGQQPGSTQTSARGVLEKLGTDGRWTLVWDRSLVNDVSPVSALVADGATYVATFDNWHSMGGGDDVVVIYGPEGKLVRSYSLYDLLPDYYVKALPRSVSSTWWSGEHRIAETDGLLILSVVVPDDEADLFDNRNYVELRVRLATGDVLPVSGAAWDKAQVAARRVAAERQKAEDEHDAWFRDPLLAPRTTEWTDWLPYLHEVFARLDPDWKAAEAGIEHDPVEIILPSAASPGFGGDAADLQRVLIEWAEPHVILFAAPGSPQDLVKALTPILAKVKLGSFKDWRIYVVCSPDYRDRFVAMFAPTGATFIHVDPAVPIPQRPERIKEMDG